MKVMSNARRYSPEWLDQQGLVEDDEDLEWTDTAPTKAGRYLWRKDRKWEPVYRDLVLRDDGRLYTYSERFLNWVPLSHIEAGGSQWHISNL